MDGRMDYNAIGIAFVDDDLPSYIKRKVEAKMDSIQAKHEREMQKELDEYLDGLGLESVMGVILEKGKVK